jgi:hypothetical protein
VAAIGFHASEVTVDPQWVGLMVIELESLITTLSDISTVASGSALRSSDNTWVIDATAVTSAPLTVEPDVFRALALTPSVSFSSIRSSRPLIRGIDADDTGFSIDGHEVVNLYHIGRSFAGFPQIGAQQVTVTSQPARVNIGHTTSGLIEIRGRTWSPERPSEIQYGLGAWSAVTGWSSGTTSAIVAGRTVAGSVVGASATAGINELSIYDMYGRVDFGVGVPLSVTVFRSVDQGTDADPKRGDTATLDWGTSLIGMHMDLARTSSLVLELSGSYSSRTERGDAIPARSTIVELDNLHRRIGGKVDGTLRLADRGPVLRIGSDLSSREIRNVIAPREPGHFPARSLDHDGTETGAYAELETPMIGGVLRSGVRIDAFDQIAAVQPRLSFQRPIGSHLWTGISAGRAARLVHLMSDARAEPKVGYYDIWLPADGAAVPVATTDHLTTELGWVSGAHRLRVGFFRSAGEGVLDLIGGNFETRQVDSWRVGRSRVIGAELEAGTASRDRRWSGQLSYTLARSERDWGEGWVPWINDRRHQLRLTGSMRPLVRTILSPSIEFNSGQPYTPFLRTELTGRSYHSVFGRENAARGRVGVRFGAALQQELRGPFNTELSLGVSVTNLGFGDQAPREAAVRFVPAAAGSPQQVQALPSSQQVSELPVIPSLMLNVKF